MGTDAALSNTRRFFVDPALPAAGSTNHAELVHQWHRVLRLVPGDELVLLDGIGTAFRIRLSTLSAKTATWDIVERMPASGEPTLHVTLAAAVIRPERYEWLLQKATEIGVAAFVPLLCERTRVDAGVTPNKLTRWERIISEAAEQSCRGTLPTLAPAIRLTDLIVPPDAAVYWLHEGSGTQPLRHIPAVPGRPIWILSGPEGGFSPAEQAWMAQQPDWHATGLGQRILRAETAPLVAATMLFAASGDFDGAP